MNLPAAHLTDKDAHFLGYSAPAFLSLLAFSHFLADLVCAAAAVPLGVALEFAQKLVPGRSCEVGDMIANTLGVCAGLVLAAPANITADVGIIPIQKVNEA